MNARISNYVVKSLQVHDKKEGKSIKLQTLESEENIEGIEQKSNSTFGGLQTKKPKKIKF